MCHSSFQSSAFEFHICSPPSGWPRAQQGHQRGSQGGWRELICFILSQQHAERKKASREAVGGSRRSVYMFTLCHCREKLVAINTGITQKHQRLKSDCNIMIRKWDVFHFPHSVSSTDKKNKICYTSRMCSFRKTERLENYRGNPTHWHQDFTLKNDLFFFFFVLWYHNWWPDFEWLFLFSDIKPQPGVCPPWNIWKVQQNISWKMSWKLWKEAKYFFSGYSQRFM